MKSYLCICAVENLVNFGHLSIWEIQALCFFDLYVFLCLHPLHYFKYLLPIMRRCTVGCQNPPLIWMTKIDPGLPDSLHVQVLSPPYLAISLWGFVAESVSGAHVTIKSYVFNSPFKQRGPWYLHCIDLVHAFWKLILVRIMHIGLAHVWTRYDMDTPV